MESHKDRIERYLGDVTASWFGDNDMPADELSEYDSYIENMKMHAERFGNLDALKQFFEHLLAHPEINTEALTSSQFAWDDEQVREIIAYAHQKIWTN
ncbi:MAG: hypothetical protein KME27_02615 [Lyngbya sp. HA4199-MV5]|jgi:hypothetical protein|nr:hypothetical protein [Lyngbya sp. HA4199-MV5]